MGLPFCAMGRVGRRQRQDICLHVRLFRAVYDEQRERKIQSILSLPIVRQTDSEKIGLTKHICSHYNMNN